MKPKTKKLVILFAALALALGFAAAELQKSVRVVVSTGTAKGQPDVAYDAQAERYLVVWQERAGSGDDRDIRARVVNRDGTPASDIVALASSGEDERLPKTAATGSSSWTVVWSTGTSIEACTVDATGKATDFRTVDATARPPGRSARHRRLLLRRRFPRRLGRARRDRADRDQGPPHPRPLRHVRRGVPPRPLARTRSAQSLRQQIRQRFVRRLGKARRTPPRRHRRPIRPGRCRLEPRSGPGPHDRRGRRPEHRAQRHGLPRNGRLPRRLAELGRPPHFRHLLRQRDKPRGPILREAHGHPRFPRDAAFRVERRDRRARPHHLSDRPFQHAAAARDRRPDHRLGRCGGFRRDRSGPDA